MIRLYYLFLDTNAYIVQFGLAVIYVTFGLSFQANKTYNLRSNAQSCHLKHMDYPEEIQNESASVRISSRDSLKSRSFFRDECEPNPNQVKPVRERPSPNLRRGKRKHCFRGVFWHLFSLLSQL